TGGSLSCNFISCAMVRRSSNLAKSSRKVDALPKRQCFKRDKTLIVIRRYDGIKSLITVRAEKTIGGIRPKNQFARFSYFFNGRLHNGVVFIAYYAIIAIVRIDAQNRYLRSVYFK